MKAFYKRLLIIAVPIMIQNVITNFVNMIDNIMVGQIGTDALSAVAICNQLLTVYIVSMSGVLLGAGIFTTQFYGRGNQEGMGYTFRFKLICSFLFTVLTCGIIKVKGIFLIGLFIEGNAYSAENVQILSQAYRYIEIMLIGLIPFFLTQVVSSTLRETEEVKIPMYGAIAAVCMNVLLNYFLIYGNGGFPRLGIAGAAVATVAARFIECGIVCIWIVLKRSNYSYLSECWKFWQIPVHLVKKMVHKSIPFFLSFFLWSMGVTTMIQCFSTRGLSAIAAYNIASTVNGIFTNVFGALSAALMIIVGQLLGTDQMEEAWDANKKIITFSVVSCVLIGAVMAFLAPFIADMYQASEEEKRLAIIIMRIMASALPCCAFTNAASGSLKSGGQAMQAMFLDGGFAILVTAPIALVLSRFTLMPIIPLIFICQYLEVIKAIIQYYFIKQKKWLRNMIEV